MAFMPIKAVWALIITLSQVGVVYSHIILEVHIFPVILDWFEFFFSFSVFSQSVHGRHPHLYLYRQSARLHPGAHHSHHSLRHLSSLSDGHHSLHPCCDLSGGGGSEPHTAHPAERPAEHPGHHERAGQRSGRWGSERGGRSFRLTANCAP